MNRIIRPLIAATLWIAAAQASALAFDVLKLVNDPEPLKCRIDGLGDTFLVARVAIEINGRTTTEQRTIQLEAIEFVDFEIPAAEVQIQQQKGKGKKALEQLRDLWESKSKWLGVPRSNSGDVALAVGDALLASGEKAKATVALATFVAVEKGDWNEHRRALAQQGKLRALLALGRAEEALAEAQLVAETAEDPTILVETRMVMAAATRREFEASLQEYPKWREDDEVREQVMEQFHTTIDQFLYPCLFHGSLEESAAEGLWNAAEVYQLAGSDDAALDCSRDIVALYPQSGFAERAKQFEAAR
ncbi:MAG: tetratricopeptide (TPR) repeat protein [Verrucomicrobiales bacterium]|jgi:tetratricopeptide (TPR) repeat protein